MGPAALPPVWGGVGGGGTGLWAEGQKEKMLFEGGGRGRGEREGGEKREGEQ